jgi:hypothetical protein
VDPITHVVTLNKPITIKEGVEITAVPEIKPDEKKKPEDEIKNIQTAEAHKDDKTIRLQD